MHTAIYALTQQGFALAKRLSLLLGENPSPAGTSEAAKAAAIFVPESLTLSEEDAALPVRFSSLSGVLDETFTRCRRHVFVTATGIAVRGIAPRLKDKTTDPAVLVVDQKGEFVISLVAGHIGGANRFTRHVADLLGATPVITTATDVEGLPALDTLATEKGLAIADMEAVKTVSAALLAGKTVSLHDPENRLGIAGTPDARHFVMVDAVRWDDQRPVFSATPEKQEVREQQVSPEAMREAPLILVTHRAVPAHPDVLALHPPVLAAGIGCKRGVGGDTILQQLRYAFAVMGASLASLYCLASASVKKDEKGILQAAEALGVPVFFFSVQELHSYPVLDESPKCLATFGLRGVCEPAALAAAGPGAVLEQGKIAGNGVTVAIARKTPPLGGTTDAS